MIGVSSPPAQLRAGRRMIDSLPAVDLLSDLAWFDEVQAWGLLCRITVNSSAPDIVPSQTDWWVTLDETYPLGHITFWPANENGLRLTFPHQLYNGRSHPNVPWRLGEICVRLPQFTFGKHVLDADPIGQNERLAWYFQRAIKWLEAAADGTLLATGDAFEFPDFPGTTKPRITVAHAETHETYRIWNESEQLFGKAELVSVGPFESHICVVRRFFSDHGKELLAYRWGRQIMESDHPVQTAIWLRCENLAIVQPYQAIDSWGELFAYLRKEGREDLFRRAGNLVRDGESHFLLLGFPIPLKVGDSPTQLHWQPIRLPVLSHGTRYKNGFRANALGYWMRDKSEVFPSGEQLDWHKAENWSRESTTCRGRIDDNLSQHTTLVIGVGAVGAVVSELLVRAGCGPMVLCDGDEFGHENLCRHILRVEDLGKNKAEALAVKLASAHSLADVLPIADAFPPSNPSDSSLAEDCSLVLDCTGDDATLHKLARHNWESEKLFCSISLSYGAKRVYVFTARRRSFPLADFQERFAPWAERDVSEFSGDQLVQAGAGCWHPAFPARIDAISMLASAAIRRLEESIVDAESEPQLVVFELVVEMGRFHGIRRT